MAKLKFEKVEKTPTSVRLSADDEKIARRLMKKLGVTFSALVPLALRALADKEGVKR